MKPSIIIFLLIVTSFVRADEGIDITDSSQIALLNNLQEELDSVTEAVMACINDGEVHKDCLCKHKDLILKFNASVQALFSSQPDFEKLDLVRFKSPDGMSVTQSLKSIRMQADMELPCS